MLHTDAPCIFGVLKKDRYTHNEKDKYNNLDKKR